ncbi:MAG TPA: helix-turn-helix transcriptional regulator, partial [Clostridia bacterium]|nr:helix-turn-helix transcriptional regulator [Clostridia bacterium]
MTLTVKAFSAGLSDICEGCEKYRYYSDWTVNRAFRDAARRLKKPTSLQVLGERIRDARKAKKLSQEDLALQAGIATSYMGGVERGERNPSFKVLCAVARIVGRDLGSLCRDLPLPH